MCLVRHTGHQLRVLLQRNQNSLKSEQDQTDKWLQLISLNSKCCNFNSLPIGA